MNEFKENMEQQTAHAFALILEQRNAGDAIYHASSDRLKSHNVATEELPMKFDCDKKNAGTLCEKLIDRASEAV